MPRTDNDIRIIPSVLDRLLDDKPGVHYENLRQLRQALKRSLDLLVNTGWLADELPKQLQRAEDLLADERLPELSQLSVETTEERERTKRAIEGVLRVIDEVLSLRGDSARQLKLAVRRDLEWLLNTRQIAGGLPAGLAAVNRSQLAYGLPDFSRFSVNNPLDRERMQLELEQAIRLFEPRLEDARVLPNLREKEIQVKDKVQTELSLGFRIEAVLKMEPAPERVVFDTELDALSGRHVVKEL